MNERAVAQMHPANAPQAAAKDSFLSQHQEYKQAEHSAFQQWQIQAVSQTFVEPRTGYDFSGVPMLTGMVPQNRPLLRTQPLLQRFAKDEEPTSFQCPTCSESKSEQIPSYAGSQTEAGAPAPMVAPTPVPSEPSEETAPPGEAALPGLVVEDSATELATGQMKKSEFLAQLRTEVCRTVEAALAGTGRTTDDCPYLIHWFDFYSRKDSAHIERTIHRYAPYASNTTSAIGYITIIAKRARKAAETWVRTGEITGVPAGVSTTVPGEEPAESGEGSAAPTSQVMFKAREAGALVADDPQAIQAELGDGQPLDNGVRSRMESTFGMDFSHVRAHTDASAGELSNRLNARAFTVGEHVAFGSGEYKPGTFYGDALIAHELAHVIQQSSANDSVAPVQTRGVGYNILENDADNSAIGVMASLWGGISGKLSDMAQNVMPRLRSGMRLSRCKKAAEIKSTTTTQNLSKKTVSGPTKGNCGQYSWTIQWLLDKVSGAKGGHVIQTITADYNVTKCNGDKVNFDKLSFQEAWPFNPNKKVTIWAEGGDVNDDTYTDPSFGTGTKGTITVIANAEYYDGITLPSDFKKNNPATQAGILPSTTTIHSLSGGSPSVPHNLTAKWNCCPSKIDKTKITNLKGKWILPTA